MPSFSVGPVLQWTFDNLKLVMEVGPMLARRPLLGVHCQEEASPQACLDSCSSYVKLFLGRMLGKRLNLQIGVFEPRVRL